MYEASFVDAAFYEQDVIEAYEEAIGPYEALWKSLRDFEEGKEMLVPLTLLPLLRAQTGSGK